MVASDAFGREAAPELMLAQLYRRGMALAE